MRMIGSCSFDNVRLISYEVEMRDPWLQSDFQTETFSKELVRKVDRDAAPDARKSKKLNGNSLMIDDDDDARSKRSPVAQSAVRCTTGNAKHC